MKFILVENLNETQERTVYNALTSWENYAYKYGKSDALFELKYHFKLTDEELAWILKQLLKKEYIDENDFNWQIKYLKLEDYFPNNLNEAYLDDEEEFYDYGTGVVSGKDIFDVNKSENSFGKDMIKLAKTGEVDYKGRAAKIGEMTPREYFEAVAKGFNSTYSSQIRQVEYDKNTLEHLRQVLTKHKRKFPITYLNLNPEDDKSFFQEGRHRMYIAGELFGWDTKFPVLQIYTKDRDKMAEIKKQENEARILKALRRAVNKSKEYSYKNVDEVKTQLEYDIESELDDIYKYKKLSLLHDPKSNTFTLIMDGEDWLIIHLDEFNIDPNKKEFDIDAEFDNISAEELAQLEKELGIKFNESLNSRYSSIIINPEDNPQEALNITKALKDYKRDHRCIRDYCGLINDDLKYYLNNKGINDINFIKGNFTTDNLNIVDYKDLSRNQYNKVIQEYGKASNENIQKFLNKYYKQEYIDNFKIFPHEYLEYKGLILDDAYPMFLKAMDNPITKNNYGKGYPNYFDENDYLKLNENLDLEHLDLWVGGGYDFKDIFDKEDIEFIDNNLQNNSNSFYRIEEPRFTASNLNKGDIIKFTPYRSFTKSEEAALKLYSEIKDWTGEDYVIFKTQGPVSYFDVQKYIKENPLDYQEEAFIKGNFKVIDIEPIKLGKDIINQYIIKQI